MSYAEAAARGPKQSPEERNGLQILTFINDHSRAPIPPQVEKSIDVSTESLVDVDSIHVSTVPSDFESQEVKTDTQATRIQHEAEDREREHKRKQQQHDIEAKKKDLKAKAESAKDKAEAKAEKAEKRIKANSDNPVVLGNAVAVVGLSALLGFGAYRKYAAGELTWKVVGIWAGVVGLFATGDYYISQYLFRTRYPPKK